jgi:cold shock protein
MREKGVIKRYYDGRGFGFIHRTGTPDVFFHVSQVASGDNRNRIQPGAIVEFEVRSTCKGLRAVDVILI